MSRKGWTSHSENSPSCAPQSQAVGQHEEVARHLHSKIYDPAESRFTTSELFQAGKDYSNVCGESDGCSVDRSIRMTAEELARRTAAIAGEMREPRPPMFGLVQDIRAILVPDSRDQAFFVYDDPIKGDNPDHAVIRGSEIVIGKGKKRALRDRLLDAFKFQRGGSSNAQQTR